MTKQDAIAELTEIANANSHRAQYCIRWNDESLCGFVRTGQEVARVRELRVAAGLKAFVSYDERIAHA